jgi:hypothetical protein
LLENRVNRYTGIDLNRLAPENLRPGYGNLDNEPSEESKNSEPANRQETVHRKSLQILRPTSVVTE